MTIVEIPLSQGYYKSDSLIIGNQECINLIPIQQQVSVLSSQQLIGIPGIRQVASSGNTIFDANRGAHVMAQIPYFVNYNRLYRLDRSFATGSEVFTLHEVGVSPVSITGTGRVSMADNGTQLMILDPGGNAFIYNKDTDVLQRVVTGIFDPTSTIKAQYLDFCDGYFVASTDSKQWFISNLNDGTQWDILDFGSAEADPDNIVAPIVYNNQIFMLGVETTEGFQNIGGSGFPFQRSNVYINKGCYAPFSLIITQQRFFMVGGGTNERAAIWAFSGGQYEKVSTNAIDEALNSYTDNQLNAIFTMSWAHRGQFFVAFTLPDRTFVFNISTGLWHEQLSSINDEFGDPEQTRWRANSLVSAYGYLLVGDFQDGRIGIFDINEYQEYNEPIVKVFSTLPISNKGNSFRINSVELTMESGIGNGVEDPVVSMAISENLKTYQYERSRKIGKIGDYGRRTIWRKNGRIPRFAAFKFRISDPIKTAIIKLEVDIV